MSWFLLLTGGQEAKGKPQPQPVPAPPWAEAQNCQDASSPTDQWEVLSQGEHSVRDREVEIQGANSTEAQDSQDASSPIDWEVLSHGESSDQDCEVDTATTEEGEEDTKK